MSTARPLLKLSAPFLGLVAFLVATLIFLWVFNDILLPFILGAILAYLLDPVVEKLDRFNGVKRPLAVTSILFGFLAVMGALLAILLPLVIREGSQFIDDLPDMIDRLTAAAAPWIDMAKEKLGITTQEELEHAINKHWKEALGAGSVIGDTLKNIGVSVINFFTVSIFTVIIAYFMLNEWPKMAAWAGDMIPRPYQNDAKELALKINAKIAGFIRGQLSVAFILGVSYAVALALAGLNYGIMIGFISGLLGVIPMVGSIIGLVVSVLVAFLQEGTLQYVGIIAAIFLTGQLIEGNVLTPKIVGDSVGLHPLWVFFALLAGASLMGLTGMLIAVPVAAIASVLIAFTIEQYKQSAYYQGHE